MLYDLCGIFGSDYILGVKFIPDEQGTVPAIEISGGSSKESTGISACFCEPDSPSDSIRMFPDRPTGRATKRRPTGHKLGGEERRL